MQRARLEADRDAGDVPCALPEERHAVGGRRLPRTAGTARRARRHGDPAGDGEAIGALGAASGRHLPGHALGRDAGVLRRRLGAREGAPATAAVIRPAPTTETAMSFCTSFPPDVDHVAPADHGLLAIYRRVGVMEIAQTNHRTARRCAGRSYRPRRPPPGDRARDRGQAHRAAQAHHRELPVRKRLRGGLLARRAALTAPATREPDGRSRQPARSLTRPLAQQGRRASRATRSYVERVLAAFLALH